MKTTKTHKRRLIFILTSFVLIGCLLAVRVAWIQFVDGAELQKKAYMQQNSGREVTAKRGSILDRNGTMLAVSATVETISINPQTIQDKYGDLEGKITKIADELAAILKLTDQEKTDLYAKMQKESMYELVKSKVDKDIGTQIRNWMAGENIVGINVDEDYKRFYPKGNLAAHIIGFTSSDNVGLDGIEKFSEEYMKGTSGKILSEVDILGRELPFSKINKIDAVDGLNVTLTIDATIQDITQRALQKAVTGAGVLEGATAIVMDPRNGDVLALVSLPDFDLNSPWAAPAGADPAKWLGTSLQDVETLQKTVWRNKAISFTYEPGSTFKAITASAGFEEGVVAPTTMTNDEPVSVGGWTINCWRYPIHGEEDVTHGLYNSCNPVFVKIALQLGVDRFYKYVQAFGFNEKTNIELFGEVNSIMHVDPSETDMAVGAFGQRFQVTPIQLITAYTAIANGGNLMKPRLIKELTDSKGNVMMKFEPEVVRNVISKETSETMKTLLEGVVRFGIANRAYVRGYRLAGKTGTSETLTTDENGRLVSSFCAFAPADNPVVSVLLILDHPSVSTITGGFFSTTATGEIMEKVLNYLGVERKYSEDDKTYVFPVAYVPDCVGKPVSEANELLAFYGLDFEIIGDSNGIVAEQSPKAGTRVIDKSVTILYTSKPEKQATATMPDLLNMNADDARLALKEVGLNLDSQALGIVTDQSIPYGTQVNKGELIQVEIKPFGS